MSTFSKLPLSGSTDGRGVTVVATAIATGTTIHTATADATLVDNITLYAYNDDTVARTLTVGWGGTTSPGDTIIQSIPAQSGLTLVVADLVLRNSLVVKASGSVASKIVLHGYVNRIA